jgi:hypothetical protein
MLNLVRLREWAQYADARKVTGAEYRDAVKHRQAAVEDSSLIRLAALAAGESFTS